MGNYHWMSGDDPHTLEGYVQQVGGETLSGAGFGGSAAAVGRSIGDKLMGTMTGRPHADTVVMGRNMPGRVEPYAARNGWGYYKGTPAPIHDSFKKSLVKSSIEHWTDKTANQVQSSVDLWFNKKWINYQMLEGKQIIDIGSGSAKEASAFYKWNAHKWKDIADIFRNSSCKVRRFDDWDFLRMKKLYDRSEQRFREDTFVF